MGHEVFRYGDVPAPLGDYAFDDVYRAPLTRTPPAIDGTVDPEEWKDAVGFEGLAYIANLEERTARAYVTADETHLYFALVTEAPPIGGLVAEAKVNSDRIVFDDAIEIWIDPTPGSDSGVAFQMLANSAGKVAYQVETRGAVRPEDYYGWKGGYQVAHGIHGGFWHCEIAVPIASVAPGRTATQGRWGLNLCRDWKKPWGFSSLGNRGYNPGSEIVFDFAPQHHAAIQVRHESDPLTHHVDARMTLRNPTDAAVPLTGLLFLKRDKMPELATREALTLAPGETRELKLEVEDGVTSVFELFALVRGSNGEIHYSRYYKWASPRSARWDVQAGEVPPADFRFAYYPYRDRLRLLAEATNLPPGAVLRSADFTVRGTGILPVCPTGVSPVSGTAETAVRRMGETPMPQPSPQGETIASIRMEAGEFEKGRCERMLELPPLDGRYEIVARFEWESGEGERGSHEVAKAFERTVYEWEHAGLGTTRAVYPPFTPITVDAGRRVLGTAMKEYRWSDTGLLESVRTDDQERLGMREILAAPMRYVAEVDGSAVMASDGRTELVEHADDRTVLRSEFALGSVLAVATGTLEYDGMLRVDLELSPAGDPVARASRPCVAGACPCSGEGEHGRDARATHGQDAHATHGRDARGTVIDRLDLDIPLRDDVAKLMHAMVDGLRYPIVTRAVPEGEGSVWNASELVTSEFPPNFCTYIFLGDALRGLCWFAENDRGWSWAPETPNLELVREGDALHLRVHLVNRPLALDAPRTITFGLQGAPVKPRLDGWRHRWFTEDWQVIGTDIHWFAEGNCCSVYPIGKDLELWHAVREATRRPLSDAEIDAIVARIRPGYERHGKKTADYAESLARKNLRNRAGKKLIYYYNRSSYPGAEEFQTFMDEWCPSDYSNLRSTRHRSEVKVVPADSYIDFALHWYGVSFDEGANRGVYVDNIFFDRSDNREMTNAYVREDGSVMPSTGLWQLRELGKRTFAYLHERGMEPLHMVHMTSAQILPLNSFYTIQYDWEWRFSEGDVHDRFPREYILACSTGEHIGAWPIVLHEQGRCVNDPWTLKTYLGVSLVHELHVDPYVWDVEPIPTGDTPENRLHAAFRQPILDITQRPGTRAYRYWDARPQPVRSTHADCPTIVYSVPGEETIIAVTSYEPTDREIELAIDPAELGLADGYRVVDVEDGSEIPVENDCARIELKRHDLREFRILPSTSTG